MGIARIQILIDNYAYLLNSIILANLFEWIYLSCIKQAFGKIDSPRIDHFSNLRQLRAPTEIG
jgi:hypothetical protein